MKRKSLHFYIIFMLLPVLAGIAAAPALAAAAASPLVSTEWLGKNLSAPGVILVDVRTEANYAFGHIPGAVNVPFGGLEPFSETEQCQLMPSPAELTELLQEAGINRASHVVIYDHGNTASDATKGAAAVWIFQAMGHENVSYLDGGFTKWTFEGRLIDNKQSTPAKGDFVAHKDSTKVATIDDIIENLKTKEAILVDNRNAEQHFGISKRADAKRFGHIPGSVSFPADYMTNAGINKAPATIKSKDELVAMAAGVGIPKDKNKKIIVYCNSAQQAGLAYLVLSEILEYKHVQVYDGSMLQYSAREELPIVTYAW